MARRLRQTRARAKRCASIVRRTESRRLGSRSTRTASVRLRTLKKQTTSFAPTLCRNAPSRRCSRPLDDRGDDARAKQCGERASERAADQLEFRVHDVASLAQRRQWDGRQRSVSGEAVGQKPPKRSSASFQLSMQSRECKLKISQQTFDAID